MALVLAFGVLVGAGYALLSLAATETRLYWFERLAIAFLLGIGALSVAWVALSPLYVFLSPVWVLSAVAAGTAGAAWRQWRARLEPRPLPQRQPCSWLTLAGSAVLLLQFAALAFASFHQPLEWDGLFNFEWRARLAFEHRPMGQLPLAFFSDASRAWSHPRYPLLVPFAEFWAYSWLGRMDQALVKILFPLFFVALVAVVCGAMRRLTNARTALACGIALGLTPSLTVGPGGATGFADVPLAAAVVAAVSCAMLAVKRRDAGAFILAGALSAVAAWTKTEGLVLALCLGAGVVMALMWLERKEPARRVSFLAATSLLWMPLAVAVPWLIFQSLYGLPEPDFPTFAPGLVVVHLHRLELVLPLVLHELVRPGHWGPIWPAFAAACVLSAWRHELDPPNAMLAAAVLVPLTAYVLVYLFSSWTDVSMHVRTSIERLLIPLAPTALMFTVSRVHHALNDA